MLSPPLAACLDALHPDIATNLRTIDHLAQEAVPPDLLALCTSYAQAALEGKVWTRPEEGLTDKEQAFIAFTEQFVTSVSNMESSQVQRLLDFAGADEVYAFVHALYVTDMQLRLDMVGREVLL